MIEPLTSPVASAVLLTLIHFLWQGAIVAICYALLRESLGRQTIHSRYAASLVTLCIMSVCPVVTFAWVYDSVSHQTPEPMTASSQWDVQENFAESNTAQNAMAAADGISLLIENPSQSTVPLQDVRRSTVTESQNPVSGNSERTFARLPRLSGPWLLLLWMAGVLLSSARLTAGLISVVWLKAGRRPVSRAIADRSQQLARRLGLATASVFESERIREAAVVGFWRPVVLLPASWVTLLPPEVIEAVIAHELAHIRRFDVWINLLQRLLETLLFYHPAVWWISNCVRLEREMCCDELAIKATGQRGSYAVALERVGRLKISGTQRLLATSFSGEPKMNLLSRIQNVLGQSSRPTQEPAWALGIGLVVLPLILAGATGFLTSENQAIAQEREERRSEEGERRRSPEAESPRRSAEEEAGPRRSPEAESRERRSEERESRERRSEEGERETRRSPERERESDEGRERRESGEGIDRFRPQTEREEVLFRMIQDLRREIAELRRVVGDRERVRDGDREVRRDRDFDREDAEGRRDRDVTETDLRPGWERSREGRVFKAYDKNGDGAVTVEEWLAMTNGNVSDARREIQTRRFKEAEPSGDGRFSAAEFIHWYRRGKLNERDGDDRESRERDGDRRDGDRERPVRGPRDGDEARERGPRDRDAEERRGPRDGDRESDERRDEESPRDDRGKDGDRED